MKPKKVDINEKKILIHKPSVSSKFVDYDNILTQTPKEAVQSFNNSMKEAAELAEELIDFARENGAEPVTFLMAVRLLHESLSKVKEEFYNKFDIKTKIQIQEQAKAMADELFHDKEK